MIANAVHRPQLGLKALRQRSGLLSGIFNRFLTCLLAINLRLGYPKLNRTNFVQTRFQRTVQQLVEFIQLAQGYLHLAHGLVAFQLRFTGFQIVIFWLGTQVGRIDIFLFNAVFLQEVKILRYAFINLFFCLSGIFGRDADFDRQRSNIRVASTLAVPEVTTCGPSGTSAACSARGNVPNPIIAAMANALSFTVSP